MYVIGHHPSVMKCHYFVWFVIPLLREAISVCHGFNIEHVSLKPELGENELSSNAGFLLHPVSRCLKWKQSPEVRWWSGDQTEGLTSSPAS